MQLHEMEKIYQNDVHCIFRMKVDGGFLYHSLTGLNENLSQSMCFVPDIDLKRYESHLRDAYTQGYKAALDDFKKPLEL
jgi:hypothetical protein